MFYEATGKCSHHSPGVTLPGQSDGPAGAPAGGLCQRVRCSGQETMSVLQLPFSHPHAGCHSISASWTPGLVTTLVLCPGTQVEGAVLREPAMALRGVPWFPALDCPACHPQE